MREIQDSACGQLEANAEALFELITDTAFGMSVPPENVARKRPHPLSWSIV